MVEDKQSIWTMSDKEGQFKRQSSTFRDTIKPEDMEPGRYILYVNHCCPWANRTIIVRALKRLEDVIDISYLDPALSDDGWLWTGRFGTDKADPINGYTRIKDMYYAQDPDYNLRFTIPVLYDKKTKRIVNNESSEIIRILNEFPVNGKVAEPDLYPQALRKEIDEINSWIYDKINNGVYKSGFATKQEAYEEHAWGVFEHLEKLDKSLADRDYLIGPGRGQLTEADVRLFPTIARFDPAYHYFFRCNLYKIAERYQNVQRWFLRLYGRPEFKNNTNIEQFKLAYAGSQMIPVYIVPIGPAVVYAEV